LLIYLAKQKLPYLAASMEIKDAKYIISSPSVDKCPKPDKPSMHFSVAAMLANLP
jgi:hypothetical protein